MIGTLRKHNVWIWWIIIAATIIGFVSYLSPSRQFGTGGGSRGAASLGSIDGEAISQKDFADAEREGRLFFFLRTSGWPDTEEKMRQVENYAYQRLLMVQQLNQMHVEVPPSVAADVTRAMLHIPDGPFPKDEFEKFIGNELTAKGG